MSDTAAGGPSEDELRAALEPFVSRHPNWPEDNRIAVQRLSAAITELVALRGVARAVEGLQHTWDALCRCVDEFEPEDMAACCERRDDLDTAILAVLAARPPVAPSIGTTAQQYARERGARDPEFAAALAALRQPVAPDPPGAAGKGE